MSSGKRRAPTKGELQAFGLGKLDPQRAGEIERHLAEHPASLVEVESAADDEMVRSLRGSGEVPAVHAHWLLRLAVEGVLPVLAGCAGALAAGMDGGPAGLVLGQVVEKAINLFGERIAAKWQGWFRVQPAATRVAAVAELAALSPEEVRR